MYEEKVREALMDINDPGVNKLLKENPAFQKLHAEHLRFEQQLMELDRAHYLTPEQELQRKTIQKLKLAGKDQMLALVRAAGGA
jgi:uncharacterized protein YdcH (DUF465 family)